MKDNKKVYSKTESGLNCPNCGQFMGPFKVCPYCRTKVKNRLDIRTFKAISVVVAVVGIAFLLVWANMKDREKWDIEDLTKRQNYAYLEFNGTVVEDSHYYISFGAEGETLPGTLSFRFDDGTGIMEVKAYQEVAKNLVKEKMIPVKGDKITISGPVNFRGYDMSLMLQDWTALEIERPDPDITVTIADIYEEPDENAYSFGKMVKVSGLYVGSGIQVESLNIDFEDKVGNMKLVIKDENDNYAIIHVPQSIFSPYYRYDEEVEDGEYSIMYGRPEPKLVTVTGHLIWDKYTPNFSTGEKGNWVIVPQRLDDVHLEVD
ncbi:MAG: hypothetical protein QGH39_00160 [Candidatus Thermoplasmatota archaeon]|nr:hypothetical protein [Candidatus Thermoplasmatota archaeon]MDP7263954.1 hypothetical protein [Candidatus Thermoplasmatota archaeon]